MEHGQGRNGRWRHRRSFRRHHRGVVAVVGTLLALLVFFALFGLFITQYLPLWMTDNESSFSADLQASMATLKSNIDLQMLVQGPAVYSTPFTMQSEGVPLLAQPTSATMIFDPGQSGVFANVSATVGPGGAGAIYRNFSLGTLTVTSPNRYYSPQIFELEDDAVIQSQSDQQQILAFPPLFAINNTGGQIGVDLAMVQMYGNATQAVSTGTQEVASHFLFSQSYTSGGIGLGVTFNAEFKIGTHFPCAWATFLSGMLTRSGIATSHYTLSPSTCIASNGIAKIVDLKFTNINAFTLVLGTFTIVMGVGVE